MEAFIILVAIAAALLAGLLYPLCPKATVAVAVMLTLFGASALAVLLLGPQDYMLRIPRRLTTLMHPYILGSGGVLCLVLGVGGVLGCAARWLWRAF